MNLNHNRQKLVLVTGASGAVGPRVVQALCSAGHQVRSFSLDALPSGTFPSGVQSLIGDVTDKSAVQSAMHGVDAVVHLAALLHIVNSPLRRKTHPRPLHSWRVASPGGERISPELRVDDP